VDRVIAHWAIPCAWPIGAASRAVLEVVSHGGDVRLLASMPGALRSRLVRAIASRASAWRFVSAPLMQELLCRLGPRLRAQLERMAVVRPPLLELPDVRAAVERKRGEMAGARVAVIVGRLVASKRVDRAIEYVECSRDVDLLVIVGDGPERARLQRLANARRVDARFMGTVDRPEALAWIGAADLLVHASHAEGLSTVVREAEALGTRVLHLS
jgi:glycosyltransferase involved in cell wall biosynthesis